MKPINKHEIEKLGPLSRRRPSLPQWYKTRKLNAAFEVLILALFLRLQKLKPETLVTINQNGETNLVNIEFKDLEDMFHLGSGHFGTVKKMRHKPTGLEFAVKVKNYLKFE